MEKIPQKEFEMNKTEILVALERLNKGDNESCGWIVDSYPHPKRSTLDDDTIAVLDRLKDSGYSTDRHPQDYIWMDTDADDPDYIAYGDDEETGEEVYKPHQAIIDRIVGDYQERPLVIVAVVVNGRGTDELRSFIKQMPTSAGIEFDIIQVERSEDDADRPTAKVIQDITIDMEGRGVLLLTWVIGTGCTVDRAAAHLTEKSAKTIKVCCVLDDVALRTVPVQIDYCVVELERRAVIGIAKGSGFNFPCLAI